MTIAATTVASPSSQRACPRRVRRRGQLRDQEQIIERRSDVSALDSAEMMPARSSDRISPRSPSSECAISPHRGPGRGLNPASQTGRPPKPCQTQNVRLSCLHPGRSCCPGTAAVSCRRCTQARLGLLRVLAANHSSWHPAIRICRSKRATTVTSGISPGARKKRFSSEIHRRSTGHAKYADFPLGWITKKRDS